MAEKLKIVVCDKGKTKVYMDGVEIKGIKRMEFDHDAGYMPEHKITYYTAVASHEGVEK